MSRPKELLILLALLSLAAPLANGRDEHELKKRDCPPPQDPEASPNGTLTASGPHPATRRSRIHCKSNGECSGTEPPFRGDPDTCCHTCYSCTYHNCCHCSFTRAETHCPIKGWRSKDYRGGD